MRVGHLSLLLLLPLSTIAAQDSLLRQVSKGTLTSPSDPAASFAIDAAFHYVGGQTIDILGVAGAEQYFFVDAASDHSIRRFVWIQFEHYYPSNTATYDYSGMELHPVQLGPMSFVGDIRTIPNYFTDDNRAGSDSKATETFLAAHGLGLQGTFVALRLFHLPDSTKRRELMIIYGEVLPDRAAAEQVRSAITAHAQAHVRVRTGAAGGGD